MYICDSKMHEYDVLNDVLKYCMYTGADLGGSQCVCVCVRVCACVCVQH